MSVQISDSDIEALCEAVNLLEHPSLAARLANLAGTPIELFSHALPIGASRAISAATTKGLQAALRVAVLTTQKRTEKRSIALHRVLATASGAAGGAFGIAGISIELPISTVIMLRSIVDIARGESENLSDPESALSCIQVFALGGRATTNDAAEAGYFAVRGLFAKSLAEAARFIAERGVVEEGAPVLVRLLTQVASRFGVVVTQKIAAQAIPVIGALGGGAVNYAFVCHFQDVARGHFTVRRLERSYGKELIRKEYERLVRENRPPL